MSNADEELVAAEIAPTPIKKPNLLTVLAIGGIILAAFKMTAIATTLPWLFRSQSAPAPAATPNVPAEMVEYQQMVNEVQFQYLPYQMAILPFLLIAAGLLFWASLKALKLAPRGDVWMRRAIITTAAIDVVGTIMTIFVQVAMLHVVQTIFEDFEGDPSVRGSEIMGIAMQVGFYIGMAANVGYVLLQFGYYFFAFQYFSKPETRALYADS